MNDIIKTINLNKSYNNTCVLKDINLTIKEGTINFIIGKSGSGKTTLLNLISGLDYPTSGNILINNELINKMKDKELANFRAYNLGFVFQFHYLIPEFTAYENVLLPLKIQRKKIDSKIKDQIDYLLKYMDIYEVKDKYPKQLSGRENQRFSILRAIISNPKIVIADEPTGNLDSINSEQIYKLIRDLHKKFQITFIIVTHAIINPLKNERIISLKDGIIIEDHTY